MGDPRRQKNTYNTPVHPWQKDRLEEEKSLIKEYGLVNKSEVYKIGSKLKKFKDIAKSLVTKPSVQAAKEKEQLFSKLKSLNLIQEENLDEVLGLENKQLLDRRLQTVVYKKGLAKSMKQARQMIVHRHISVDGKMISSPSYLVRVSEENAVAYYAGSSFNDENHPELVEKGPSKDKIDDPEKEAEKTKEKKESKKEDDSENKKGKEESKAEDKSEDKGEKEDKQTADETQKAEAEEKKPKEEEK